MPVFFLDTGFHFQETLAFRDRLVKELGLELKVLKPEIGHGNSKRRHGELYRSDPDLCCYINKVEPMKLARRELKAWISGIRRDQSRQRSRTPIVSRLPDGAYKICPMATWTRQDVAAYRQLYRLPEHPLGAQGYLSIGCSPCTQPATGDDERSGRWAGSEKTECGLHVETEK